MKKDQERGRSLLGISYTLVNVGSVLLLVLWSACSSVMLYSMWYPDAFSNIVVEDMLDAGYSMSFTLGSGAGSADSITLSKLDVWTKIVLLIRGSLLFGIVFLMLRSLRDILRGVITFSTFISNNIHHFRRLCYLAILLGVVCSFNINFLDDGINIRLALPIKILAMALGFLVLSEIFVEGKILEEDKNSIV